MRNVKPTLNHRTREERSDESRAKILAASVREVSAVTNLGSTPLVVLSHSPRWRPDPTLPGDVSDKMQLRA